MKVSRRRRKGQVQMGETITVVLIIMFLLALSLMFYGKVKGSSIKEAGKRASEVEFISLAKLVLSLPELSCSTAQVIDEGCVDLYKAEILSEKISEAFNSEDKMNSFVFNYYLDLFGNSKIELKEVYPEQRNITLYNATLDEYTSRQVERIPVVVYDPKDDRNTLGVLVLTRTTP